MKKMNKTQFDFFKHNETGKVYMEVLVTTTGLIILKQMFGNGDHISVTEADMEHYTYLNEDDVYAITKEMSNEEYSTFMGFVGAYTCPFCGGKLHWESDFMTSEVRGLEHTYYQITDENHLMVLRVKEEEYKRANILGVTSDIEAERKKAWEENTYDFMYLRFDNKETGETTYWSIDDPVIGIYECGSCGKRYEIQDPYEHEYDEDDSEDNYYE